MPHASLTFLPVKFEILRNVLISAASRICIVFAVSGLVSATYVKIGHNDTAQPREYALRPKIGSRLIG